MNIKLVYIIKSQGSYDDVDVNGDNDDGDDDKNNDDDEDNIEEEHVVSANELSPERDSPRHSLFRVEGLDLGPKEMSDKAEVARLLVEDGD